MTGSTSAGNVCMTGSTSAGKVMTGSTSAESSKVCGNWECVKSTGKENDPWQLCVYEII